MMFYGLVIGHMIPEMRKYLFMPIVKSASL